MQETADLVSIYIPTCNRFDLLQRAVASCLAQTYAHIEVIISDDGSTAEVQQKIQALAATDPRIKLVLTEQSVGACAARNKAIALATGKFVTGLDDDDEFKPNRVELFVKAWHVNPGMAFISTNSCIYIDDSLKITSRKKNQIITLQDLLHTNVIGNQLFTLLSSMRTIGGFDEELQARQDYDAWIRLVEQFGPGYRISDVTYIIHQGHNYQRISNSSRRVQGYDYVFKKHEHKMNSAQKASHKFYRCLYTENPSLWTLLPKTPLRLWPVAIKVISLRMLGYKV